MRRRIHVVAALIERDGLILVGQRPEGTHLAGLWEFPGGKPELGETSEQALARELHEELGIEHCVVGPRVDSVEHAYPEFDLALDLHPVQTDETPRALQAAALRWVAPAELPTMPMPEADRPLVGRLLERIRG